MLIRIVHLGKHQLRFLPARSATPDALRFAGMLFVQVVRLAREIGLVNLGAIAVDGTKLQANASRHKAMSCGHMQRAEAELNAQITALVKKVANTNEVKEKEPDLDIPAAS